MAKVLLEYKIKTGIYSAWDPISNVNIPLLLFLLAAQ